MINLKKLSLGFLFISLLLFMMVFNVTKSNNSTEVSLTGKQLQANPSCFECSAPLTETCLIINGIEYEGVKKEVDCPNGPAVPEKN